MAELPYTPWTGTRSFVDATCRVSSGPKSAKRGKKKRLDTIRKQKIKKRSRDAWGNLAHSLTLTFQSILGSGTVIMGVSKGNSEITLLFPQSLSNQNCITLAWRDGTPNQVVFSMHHHFRQDTICFCTIQLQHLYFLEETEET